MGCNNRKCKECNLCLDLIYLEPNLEQFWHCFLCERWYKQDAEGNITEVPDPNNGNGVFIERS